MYNGVIVKEVQYDRSVNTSKHQEIVSDNIMVNISINMSLNNQDYHFRRNLDYNKNTIET